MRLGVTMFATDRSMNVAALAREAEVRGFASLYLPEHTHIPASRLTPAPTGEEVLPEEYRRTVDPFVALGGAAAVTSKIVLGTGICLVAQRDPIVLAKATATLDAYSGGRFCFGVGFGWNREEMGHHGVDFRSRRDLVRERVLAIKTLWTQEAASYSGKHVRFTDSWSWPKPVQSPHPPILIGGAAGPKLFSHIAEYADGWIPIGGGGVAAALPALRAAVADTGRDPASVRVVPFGTIPRRDKLDYYAQLGIDEVVLRIPSKPESKVLPILDQYAGFITPE